MDDHSPSRPPKAAAQTAQHIEQLILEGTLTPGEQLAPERDLAERLGVSRPTLRDALRMLTDRGLLTRRARGVEVAQLGGALRDPLMEMLTRAEVADDYLEFREVVESEAAAMAANRATDIDRQRLRDCIEAIEAAHARNEPDAEAQADADLHVAVYEASHNLVLLQIMRALSGSLRSDVLQNRQRLFTIPQVRDILRDQHMAIAAAIVAGDADAARDAAHDHLQYLRKALREIREAEAKLDLSLRRLKGGGLSASRG
ncbi:FCD domain-containing protein [Paracoccus sp. 1_MG-2023]|uniref:FCD domain-containing protein n=1 Tax=unclassified Paracoccus (in: a-proteobacteria) TaxID=2688777 RepID=UPI001C09B4C3|nr:MULTISPECIES: FCD domain-containing protein [unclassified Paracoccus (in: a-proteobacteria)]MBU2956069.1 FCD domain-containing protein [Paracoccus sp. C2R09]MDO6669475.1 FCD domain-containing protein [Paracoccus sp. 1_MG-2023]